MSAAPSSPAGTVNRRRASMPATKARGMASASSTGLTSPPGIGAAKSTTNGNAKGNALSTTRHSIHEVSIHSTHGKSMRFTDVDVAERVFNKRLLRAQVQTFMQCQLPALVFCTQQRTYL
jgi:hypothetical protein